MIIVAGTVSIDPSDFEAYREAAEVMIAATLEEDGCHVYNFAQSVVDASEVRVFEIWESEDHLKAHMQTPHMAVWRSALADLKMGARDLATYEAEKTGTV